MKTAVKTTKRLARKRRIRSKLIGTATRPRLSIFRSNSAIYAQLIDDANGVTVASASNMKDKANNIESAAKVGKDLADAAKKAKISECIFDRNGYKYHGRIKALADAAREGGLAF